MKHLQGVLILWIFLSIGIVKAQTDTMSKEIKAHIESLNSEESKAKRGQAFSPEEQAYYESGVAERQKARAGKQKDSAAPNATVTGSMVTYPEVSEKSCPAQVISITGKYGNEIPAVVRQPPGHGPFPAIVLLHGGLFPYAVEKLKKNALTMPTHTRFLAAGYITVTPTFRSRKKDPQTRDALEDCLATIEYVRKMSAVDPKSIVVMGGSGGGSLALELAGEADICAVAAGEPASVLFTGVMQRSRDNSEDSAALQEIMNDPKRFYSPKLQEFTRAKIAAIHCPVLIGHGDRHAINKINEEIIIPEIKAAKKMLQVIAYPGQPHGFYFGRKGDPAAGQKFFDDADAFFKRYLPTKPTPIDESLIKRVPITPATRNAR